MRSACTLRGPIPRAIGKTTAILACSALALFGQPKANPYLTIADRNMFGLREPAPPKPIEQAPPPRPAPKLVLTGVVDFSTAQWAFVTRTDAGRPPVNYTLTLGETEGGLQLVDVDVDTETVTVRVDGLDTVDLELPAVTNRTAAIAAPAFPKVSLLGRPRLPRR